MKTLRENTVREHARKAVQNKQNRENAFRSLAIDLVGRILTDKPKSMYNKDGTLRIL